MPRLQGGQDVATAELFAQRSVHGATFSSRNGNFSTIKPGEHSPHGGPFANAGFREDIVRIDATPVLAWGGAEMFQPTH